MVQMWRDASARGERAALATVVQVRGSVYRRPGARLLMLEDGTSHGLISGGCLENDVRARCREVLESGQSTLVTYDTTSSQDIVWGLGLGCRGVVQVLVEPLLAQAPFNAESFNALSWLGEGLERGQCSVLATIYAAEPASDRAQVLVGARLMLRGDDFAHDEIAEFAADLAAQMQADAHLSLYEERSFNARYEVRGAKVEAFVEFVAPPLPLTIFGTGEDAQPLASLARQMGWHVTVVDTRDGGPPACFPDAHQIIKARPEEVGARLPLDARAVAVVMTHNFLADWEILKALLPSSCRYIGLLGPKRRANELLERLSQRSLSSGIEPTPPQLERLHAPIGLDIGAETPEEIALSIIAEIKAHLSQRSGGFLRARSGGIHDPPSPQPSPS